MSCCLECSSDPAPTLAVEYAESNSPVDTELLVRESAASVSVVDVTAALGVAEDESGVAFRADVDFRDDDVVALGARVTTVVDVADTMQPLLSELLILKVETSWTLIVDSREGPVVDHP